MANPEFNSRFDRLNDHKLRRIKPRPRNRPGTINCLHWPLLVEQERNNPNFGCVIVVKINNPEEGSDRGQWSGKTKYLSFFLQSPRDISHPSVEWSSVAWKLQSAFLLSCQGLGSKTESTVLRQLGASEGVKGLILLVVGSSQRQLHKVVYNLLIYYSNEPKSAIGRRKTAFAQSSTNAFLWQRTVSAYSVSSASSKRQKNEK